MKERGILFSDVMVRALLDGRKTQTRRIVKLPSWTSNVTVDPGGTIWGAGPYLKAHRAEPVGDDVGAMERIHCPYGNAGDRLWVREVWQHGDSPMRPIIYRATDEHHLPPMKWKPSIHLHRVNSRITLELTGVRAQQLGDISEDDAHAEGATPLNIGSSRKRSFIRVWEGINGDGSWAANPWVWALTFKVVSR